MRELFLTEDMDLLPHQCRHASKEEFFHELDILRKQYEKVAVYGRNRTCFSLLYESEPFYLSQFDITAEIWMRSLQIFRICTQNF